MNKRNIYLVNIRNRKKKKILRKDILTFFTGNFCNGFLPFDTLLVIAFPTGLVLTFPSFLAAAFAFAIMNVILLSFLFFCNWIEDNFKKMLVKF